ncbi:MAG: stage III sporulation protein AD [Clostridia bacterium]|nr:stage III sporulation protein AD [Clostridia bacterium]
MEILQIVGLGIVASVLIVVLKAQKPEMAVQVSIITGVIVFVLIAGKISAVIGLLDSYTRKAHIDFEYFTTLLKIIGIAYIAEFGAEVCKDAGESSIASKIELAAKVIIIVIAVPIITSLLDLIIKIMP